MPADPVRTPVDSATPRQRGGRMPADHDARPVVVATTRGRGGQRCPRAEFTLHAPRSDAVPRGAASGSRGGYAFGTTMLKMRSAT